MNPLISVIVPIYNVEAYLQKCIDSLISQTYPNLEIILVNDGSTDASGAICDSYKNDSRIKVIHNQNMGVADARNAGLAAVSGSLIGFLDGDDFISSDFYSYLYKILVENTADVAQCNFKKVFPAGAPLKDNVHEVEEQVTDVTGRYMLENLRNSDLYPTNTILGNKLYKREIFSGLQFESGKLHEDENIIHQIYYKVDRISLSSKALYYYVQRPGSIMGIAKLDRFEDIVSVYEARARFFEHAKELRLKELTLFHEFLALVDLYLNFKSVKAQELLVLKKRTYLKIESVPLKHKILLYLSLKSKSLAILFINVSNMMKSLKKVTVNVLR